jgi:hypothetical protein
MNIVTKSLMSAGAAAVALVGVAAPLQARDRYDRDNISAGEVIAGAVILGGLAAVLSSGNNRDRNDGRYEDNRYRDRNGGYDNDGYNNGNQYGYDRGGNGREAVSQCVAGVERWASRYSRAEVTEIRDIQRTRNGYVVQGKLVVQDGWRGRDRNSYGSRGYGNQNYGNDYDRGHGRGYDRGNGYGNDRGYDRGYDKGRFTCYIERGRVVDIDYSGLDQWR